MQISLAVTRTNEKTEWCNWSWIHLVVFGHSTAKSWDYSRRDKACASPLATGYSWFSCDVMSPQNPLTWHMPLFWLQKWIQLGHVSQVANFWLSSHNFGEVAVIKKFPKIKDFPTWLPHTKLSLILEILKFLNYSFFAKIMTRKPNIGNLTNMTELYPFLESKKWYLLFKGILSWWKPSIDRLR